jgi:hypothetical protein
MPKEAWMLKEMGLNSQAEKIFSLSQGIQSICGAHPASYFMGKVACFLHISWHMKLISCIPFSIQV